MPHQFSRTEIDLFPRIVSAPRFGRYLKAQCMNNRRALALYRWNAQVASAFLFPLSICEVTLRNAVVEVIQAVHGGRWPWSENFAHSLPNPRSGYSPKADLIKQRMKHRSSSKIVADLKFSFWESMLTRRHDGRFWMPFIRWAFPALPAHIPVRDLRSLLYRQTVEVRRLRNRIAHHEPVFHRDLRSDYERARTLVHWRSPEVSEWLHRHQAVTSLLEQRP